jgi:peptidoglycan hydrolase FlgJ
VTAALATSFDSTNPQGLAALREAGDTPDARRAVAKQFEALFLGMMMREMRQASSVIDGGLIDKDRIELQQGLFDEQIALKLAQGRGIGLADALLRQLGGPAPANLAGNGGQPLGISSFGGRGTSAAVAIRSPDDSSDKVATEAPLPSPEEASTSRAFTPGAPAEFVAALWPHAAEAAQRLGTLPGVLVAQAAIETGWGRSVPRNQYGESSLNLFGIKADRNWQGPRAVVTTLEFVDGVPEQRREPFRMYKSVAEAFDDYVALLESRPRYAEALRARTPAAYAEALQRGGYATDPDYARKILDILARGLPGHAGQVIDGSADIEAGDTRPVHSADGEAL